MKRKTTKYHKHTQLNGLSTTDKYVFVGGVANISGMSFGGKPIRVTLKEFNQCFIQTTT